MPLSIYTLIWLIPAFGHGAWAVRIRQSGLLQHYRSLFLYNLVAGISGIAAFAVMPLQTRVAGWLPYTWVWMISRPIIWILFFVVVAQLFVRMLSDYPALQRTGRTFLFATFIFILVIGALTPIAGPLSAETSSFAARVVNANQSVYMSTSALVFVLFMFRRFFFLKVTRNVDIAFVSLGLYFAGIATLVVLRGHVGPDFINTLNLLGCAWSSVCVALGAILFAPSNERVPQFAFTPKQRQEMLQAANDRLESINSQVARALAS